MMMTMVTLIKYLKNNNHYLEIGKKIQNKLFLNAFSMILNSLNLMITFKIKIKNLCRNAMILYLKISVLLNLYFNIFSLKLGAQRE